MERDLQEIKEEIRARSDIVEVVGQYTSLKRSGKNWTGLCPFHADRRPSFSVSPSLQIYKCYSCGEGGDVFTFVQKKENLDFVESLEYLAKRAGIQFTRQQQSPEQQSELEGMVELNEVAARFYQDGLARSQEARDYLANRAILKETQDQFLIGYAPPDWEGLTYFLQRRRMNMELAAKLGLVRARQQDGTGFYDWFRSRIIFPILDVSGRIVAFGGRALGDETPKYLNSEESRLFHKSRTLYGLNFARKKLSATVPPVFVEGYLDVVTAHQSGFTQCVATLGTSMTEDHARALSKYNPKVVICYDGDAAGVRATLRGARIWENIGVEGAQVSVARMPPGEDPDSILRRGDVSVFQAAIDNAVPRIEFELDLCLAAHDLRTPQGRADALAEAIPIISTVEKLSQRDLYAQRIAILHPSHAISASRAIAQILSDAARVPASGPTPRDHGYPLTEQTNRRGLKEQPDAGGYRPPSSTSWGGMGAPAAKGGGKRRGRREDRFGTPTDSSLPSTEPPALIGVQKAELQLLRACFSADMRPTVLATLTPSLLVTETARRLYEIILRTPANAEGELDPQPLLAAALREEEETLSTQQPGLSDLALLGGLGTAKISVLLQMALEDSSFLVSNESLNEKVVSACIARLREFRKEQDEQAIRSRLQSADSLPPDERRALLAELQKQLRETRGSAPPPEERT